MEDDATCTDALEDEGSGVGLGGGVITFGWMCLEDDTTCAHAPLWKKSCFLSLDLKHLKTHGCPWPLNLFQGQVKHYVYQ